MSQNLPIASLIKVSVSLSALAAQAQNLSTLLIVGTSNVIDLTTRARTYVSIDEVAADFGTNAPEYLAALLWFEQSPQPVTLMIGRWANANTAGQLVCAPFTPAQQVTLLAALKAITTGSFTVSIDGTPENITALNFSADNNLPACAATIQTALNTAVAGTTCVWNAIYGQFIITSPTTGAASAISFLTAEGTGVDISATIGGQATSSGAYLVAGAIAETALAAVTALDNQYGQDWYAVTVVSAAVVDADHEAIAPYIESTSANKHFYGVTTQEAGCLVSSSTTDIAYILSQAKYNRTAVQYSSTNPYAICSLFGRILTTDYTGNNTTITLMYKQEPGIVAESLTTSQAAVLQEKNCNVFAFYNNNTAIIQYGVCASGEYIDVIMGADSFAIAVQTALYNALYTTTTKIPQTDAGMGILSNTIETVALQYVANGLFAPGTWTGAPFGTIQTNQWLPKGYSLYTPSVASQAPSNRAARQSVPFQLGAKLAGAVHTANLAVTINQ